MSDQLPRIISPSVPGPNSAALAARLGRIESPDTTYLSTDFPIFWESAHGCLVTDVDGNRFLDATSSFGAMSVGHAHPEVVAALTLQSEKLIHGMGDVHPSRVKVELLEKIAARAPIANPRIILGQSGAEAVESALKTAYLASGKPGVIAFDGGYHGLSYGALEPTARSFFRNPFERQRGRFARHMPFGASMDVVTDAIDGSPIAIGAVIAEPIQGRGGIRVPPAGWLRRLSDECAGRGVLLIVDEIYTGWGRTGKMFACEFDAVWPDLVCVGKAMGGGMPISACVGRAEIIEAAWPKSKGEALHTSTFLGHPLACAGALAAIEVIVRDGLPERAARLGDRLLRGLSKLVADHADKLVEARGRGLMAGIAARSGAIANRCMLECLRRGLIVLPAGDMGDVIEITPPLVISESQLDWCLACLDESLGAVSAAG